VIPLVILDLDGTMIGSDGQVATEVWAAVERAREQGVKLVACTGRPGLGVAQRVAMRLGRHNPHIFQSGAHIAYPDGETLKATSLKEAAALQLVRHARELGLVLEVYTPNHLYVERKTQMSEVHARMIGVQALVRDLSDVVANEPVIRAQWVLTPDQEAAAMTLKPEGVTISRATSPAQKDTLFVSMTRAGVSKGSAIQDVANQLKVPLAHAMAVGDTSGDLPMLALVGYPVVMGNAEPALKARFPQVVGDVDHGGVIEALEMALTLKPA
jgi:Cof subfamily protein (haloacid dehalogenase superfamily)